MSKEFSEENINDNACEKNNGGSKKDNIFEFTFKDLCVLFIIALSVSKGWQWLELYIYGEIKPNQVDTIIAIILNFSLYLNYKFYELHKKK